jgi:ribosomal-protein-alanine N-acetyltransferase
MHSLRPLTRADLPALLEFERQNRAYFEQWVPPRPEWFFKEPARYNAHMVTLLKEQQSGGFRMYVLTDRRNQILGRVNLTISSRPSLGYRIDQTHTSKGLATLAVQQICTLAKSTLRLADISAQAAQNNMASQQVLLNNGFERSLSATQKVELNGQPIWLERFHKRL